MTYFVGAIQEQHHSLLTQHFFADAITRERAAFLLFGKSIAYDETLGIHTVTLLSKDVFILQDEEALSSSGCHVTWDNQRLLPLLKRAAQSGMVVGIVHSHLNYPPEFSDQDDEGERGLIELIQHRNGSEAALVSIVLSSYGTQNARIWHTQLGPTTFDEIRIGGGRFSFQFAKVPVQTEPHLVRQALAFGNSLNQTLAALQITIVGCGGTGSAVAMLLARLGVKNFTLIDPDIVEESNLNRLHGATLNDARDRKKKVDVVSRHIKEIGYGAVIRTFASSVTDNSCRDALKVSDVVFGCTDDNRGRLLLNRLAYFYLIPVIDLGLAIEVSTSSPFRILALDGRVSVMVPGATCLICRGVINTTRAREESLMAMDPEEYKRQKLEAYVIGEGNPSPSVVTFTTEVATMAVNELIHRIQGFRGPSGSTPSRTRQFHRMHDLRTGDRPLPDCPVCGNDYYWGIGDVEPFLDQVW